MTATAITTERDYTIDIMEHKQELGEPNTGTDGKTILIFSPPPAAVRRSRPAPRWRQRHD